MQCHVTVFVFQLQTHVHVESSCSTAAVHAHCREAQIGSTKTNICGTSQEVVVLD